MSGKTLRGAGVGLNEVGTEINQASVQGERDAAVARLKADADIQHAALEHDYRMSEQSAAEQGRAHAVIAEQEFKERPEGLLAQQVKQTGEYQRGIVAARQAQAAAAGQRASGSSARGSIFPITTETEDKDTGKVTKRTSAFMRFKPDGTREMVPVPSDDAIQQAVAEAAAKAKTNPSGQGNDDFTKALNDYRQQQSEDNAALQPPAE